MFKIAQKVICINDKFPAIEGEGLALKGKPKKYDVLPVFDIYLHENLGLFLSFEIYNTPEENNWFAASHFRPLDEFIDNEELAEMLQDCNLVHV